jgi:hypothetical protein
MAKLDYRVLYNYDSGPIFFQKEPVTPEHVDAMVDEVADAGVDALLVCVNDQVACFPSRTWQRFWDGFEEGDRSFFVDVPEERIENRIHWIKQTKRLADQCDYLERAMARCRQRGIAAGLSMRMNDMHGGGEGPRSHMRSKFYQENPQFHTPCIEPRGYAREALDYSHKEVRDRSMALIKELVEYYDHDVLELDFSRFAFYFDRSDKIEEHCEVINGFLREVRDVIAQSGLDIKVIIRIASNPGAARQLGFDVEAWGREQLVDGITPTQFINSGWEIPIDQFRELAGPDIAIYPGTMSWAHRWEGLPPEMLVNNPELLRGFTTGYHALGADGINFFNFFCCRASKPPIEPSFSTIAELRDPESLRGKPRRHVLSGGLELVEFDLPCQLPVDIAKDKTRRFEMVLAPEADGAEVFARFYLAGENKPEDMWLRIGMHPVGHAAKMENGPQTAEAGIKMKTPPRESKMAIFKVPPGVLQDGRNEFFLRSENVETTVLGLDVCIGC